MGRNFPANGCQMLPVVFTLVRKNKMDIPDGEISTGRSWTVFRPPYPKGIQLLDRKPRLAWALGITAGWKANKAKTSDGGGDHLICF